MRGWDGLVARMIDERDDLVVEWVDGWVSGWMNKLMAGWIEEVKMWFF